MSYKVIPLVLLLAACDVPKVTDKLETQETSTGEIHVKRVGVFTDQLAYGDRRGIYEITDTRTGQRFIGVSGVGITESGSHTQNCGKNCTQTIEDER